MTLYEKIQSKTAAVGVVGLGYVGLPLAVEKAKAGFTVIGFDVQADKVDRVNRGENYIGDVVPEELAALVKSGHLSATTDMARLSNCDVIAICVPTPLDTFKQPDLSFVESSARAVASHAHADMLVVLESTTYPGTTEEVLKPLFEKAGFAIGTDLYLAFSPERVDPGNARFKTKNTPKVVGGCTPECTRHAKALYEAVLEAPVFAVSSPKEAEMTKILENTFRIVNCALANELSILCDEFGIDAIELIRLANRHPRVNILTPGPGVGGHCIAVDPWFIVETCPEKAPLITTARRVNDNKPRWLAGKALGEIRALFGERRATVGILGLAYKADVEDLRESPSLEIARILSESGCNVIACEPNISMPCVSGIPNLTIEEVLERSDYLVLAVIHRAFLEKIRTLRSFPHLDCGSHLRDYP